jgi:hypothetical protein
MLEEELWESKMVAMIRLGPSGQAGLQVAGAGLGEKNIRTTRAGDYQDQPRH